MLQVDGKRTLELFRWGLIPWWAKDPAIGNRMINALANWYGMELCRLAVDHCLHRR
jgi:putative SOS response-associated peptidase YedK